MQATISIRCTESYGTIKAGQVFQGVVTRIGTQERVDLSGLPRCTAHPTLFLNNGKPDGGRIWNKFEIA